MNRRSFLSMLVAALFAPLAMFEKKPEPMSPMEDIFLPTAIKVIGYDPGVEGSDRSVLALCRESPDRRVFVIDVGEMPKGEAEAYVKRFMEKFRDRGFKLPGDDAEPTPV